MSLGSNRLLVAFIRHPDTGQRCPGVEETAWRRGAGRHTCRHPPASSTKTMLLLEFLGGKPRALAASLRCSINGPDSMLFGSS